MTVRPPTYPERSLAFRFYPVGWWVQHVADGWIGYVLRCGHSSVTVRRHDTRAHHDTYVDRLVSCTARQVAALESVP